MPACRRLLGLALTLAATGLSSASADPLPAPYQFVGVGRSTAWAEYRKHQLVGTNPDYPSVAATRGDHGFAFENVRQGCDTAGGCAFLAPGLFVAGRPARESPGWALPVFEAATTPGFDVRLGFIEAGPDDDLGPFVAAAGGDLGARADLYFGGFPNDFLSVHLWIAGSGPTRTIEVREVTCHTAGSTLLEYQRTNHRAAPTVLTVPELQPVRWAIVESGPSTDLVVESGGTEIWRWPLSGGGADLLRTCGNPDLGAYASGAVDLDRLVPVLFVGWATFEPPDRVASLTLGFQGWEPFFEEVPAVAQAGVPQTIRVSVRDHAGARLLDGDHGVVLTATGTTVGDGLVAWPTSGPDGEASVTVRFGQTGEQTLRLALEQAPEVYVEQRVEVTPGRVELTEGCAGCSSGGSGSTLLLGLAALVSLRRRR